MSPEKQHRSSDGQKQAGDDLPARKMITPLRRNPTGCLLETPHGNESKVEWDKDSTRDVGSPVNDVVSNLPRPSPPFPLLPPNSRGRNEHVAHRSLGFGDAGTTCRLTAKDVTTLEEFGE